MYLCDEIIKIANENYISCEVWEEAENVVAVSITMGDWKHDHLRIDWLVAENLNPKNSKKEVIDEDGSDAYSAIHRFYF